MSDWADKALKRLSDKKINQQLQDSVFLEKQRIKKEHGMSLWLEVREKVNTNCTELNTKARKQILDFEVTVNTELSVTATEGWKNLHASFSESTGKLSWRSKSGGGSWTIEANAEGNAEFRGDHGLVTVEQIADEMLSALV